MTTPNILFDMAGIQARIFHLSGRPPFMTVADLAEVYNTTPKRIGEAVKRNPARFPERYAFRLSEAEEAQMWTQFATTYGKKRNDVRALVLTHGGANMLASVLRGDVADQMAVAINDAFTEMEQQAISDAKAMLLKLRTEAGRKPIYVWIKTYVQEGRSFEELWRSTNYSRPKLEQAAREMLAQGLIPQLPNGLQGDLFGDA